MTQHYREVLWIPVFLVALLLFLLGDASVAAAQDTDSPQAEPQALPQQAAPPPDLDETVQFSARDSLVILFDDEGGDKGVLVGNAQVTYGDATLQAHTMDLLLEIDELRARGLPSDTGMVGRPQFNQGSETFSGDQLAYNLRTERGRVVGAQTNIQDGFIQAGVVKVDEDSTLYIQDGLYTTCRTNRCETPSYSLRSNKMKIVNQKWIYTGPLQLFIFSIPTPLWLPFGFLPAQEGRRSGPLPPQYGEDERGFYLRDWGWYWAINEFMDLQVRAGIWTKGSWQISPLFRYDKRYRYSGQFSFDFLRERNGERGDPNFTILNRARIRWSHNQTINPTSSFNADVNLTTQGYLQTVSENYDDRVRQTISSNVRYQKRWSSGGQRISANLSQQQTLSTGAVNLSFPQLSFSQSSFKPFRRSERSVGQDESWYERITLSYNSSLNNRYNFRPLDDETLLERGDTAATEIDWYDALFSPSRYRRATGDDEPFDFQATHRIPISASFSARRLNLNLSPSANYEEEWFIQTERRRFDDSTATVVRDSEPGFFALRQFSTGVSANTTIYGIFPVGAGPYQGIRHTMRPTLSFSYRPDFSDAFWGYTRTYTDTLGNEIEYPIVSGVQGGRQQALSFRLSNVFETKRVAVDSTGESQSRVLKMLNADLSTSYNFAADSLKLSTIRLNGRTNILGMLNVNFSSSFSPYKLNDAGTREIDAFVFDPGKFKLARLTSLRLSTSFSLRSDRRSGVSSSSRSSAPPRAQFQENVGGNTGGSPYGPDPTDPFTETRFGAGDTYADFSIPWSLNVDLSYSVSKRLRTANRRATVNASFDFNLTPNWKIRGRTGFDFIESEIASTQLNLHRDLGCWEMSFNWVPFGRFQSWGFELHVKSGKLRDILRIRQPRSDIKGRFGRLVQSR